MSVKAVYDCETRQLELEPLSGADKKQAKSDAAAHKDLLAAELRARRDALLAASDWTQVPDAPLSAAARKKWATYRQQLRDLPAKTKDPANPSWPKPPA